MEAFAGTPESGIYGGVRKPQSGHAVLMKKKCIVGGEGRPVLFTIHNYQLSPGLDFLEED
jgi:hypothetical protein